MSLEGQNSSIKVDKKERGRVQLNYKNNHLFFPNYPLEEGFKCKGYFYTFEEKIGSSHNNLRFMCLGKEHSGSYLSIKKIKRERLT